MSIKRMELAIRMNGLTMPSGGEFLVPIDLKAIHELQERARAGEKILNRTSFVAIKGGPRPDGRQFNLKGQKSVLIALADKLESDYTGGLRMRIGVQEPAVMLGLVRDIRTAVR